MGVFNNNHMIGDEKVFDVFLYLPVCINNECYWLVRRKYLAKYDFFLGWVKLYWIK